MSYALGVDLGTTFTAAAIKRGDRPDIAELGNRAATVPSVVFLREDETFLTGDAAVRRGATEPGRVAREFKRRMGDTTPVILGGSPLSVDALMTRVLADVVAAVTEREGEQPEAITVAYPANWGQYKKDLLEQAFRRADLDSVTTITEPEAAAAHYASQERLEPGETIAVYDLGGGTFDAAVLRATGDGFEFLGDPEGIERLGGIDFDEAVYRHVVDSLGGALDDIDPTDPVAQAAVARLRAECVAAKEALSSDTDVSIPVLLPTVQTEVRLTRAEFEGMIRPALADTLVVLNRAIRSAGITPDELHAVLLVGGSSRVPLVGQIVGAELGRPVAVDVHPKHSVALGAALIAATHAPSSGASRATGAVAGGAVAGGAVAAAAGTETAPDEPGGLAEPLPPIVAATAEPVAEPDAPPIAPAMPAAATPTDATAPDTTEPIPTAPDTTEPIPTEPIPTAPIPTESAPTTPLPIAGTDGTDPPQLDVEPAGNRNWLLIGGSLAVIAAILIGFFVLTRDDGDGGLAAGTTVPAADPTTPTTDQPESDTTVATTPVTTAAPTTAAPTTVAPTTAAPTTTLPPAPCDGIGGACVEIESLQLTPESVTISWIPFNFTPDVNAVHPHFYWNDSEAFQAGTNAPDGQRVGWEITQELVYTGVDVLLLANQPAGATGICVTPGDALLDPPHSVIDPEVFHCVDLP